MRNAGGGEIIVGINAHTAARALRLTFTEWAFTSAPQPQPTGYLAWVRGHVDAGHPVIAGVYMAVMNDSGETRSLSDSFGNGHEGMWTHVG